MKKTKDCIHRMRATKFDYTGMGCKHSDMDGFICNAFENEGEAIWMVGCDDGCMCELYEKDPKEKTDYEELKEKGELVVKAIQKGIDDVKKVFNEGEMARYVDATKAYEAITKAIYDDYYWEIIEEAIDSVPTADVRENKHGEWCEQEDDSGFSMNRYCSVCGDLWANEILNLRNFNFCPNCGADMRFKK